MLKSNVAMGGMVYVQVDGHTISLFCVYNKWAFFFVKRSEQLLHSSIYDPLYHQRKNFQLSYRKMQMTWNSLCSMGYSQVHAVLTSNQKDMAHFLIGCTAVTNFRVFDVDRYAVLIGLYKCIHLEHVMQPWFEVSWHVFFGLFFPFDCLDRLYVDLAERL